MAVIPAALKSFTSALRRAEELEKDASNLETQVVAYFCRLYIVTKGSKLCNGDNEAGAFLLSQMDALEKMKPSLGANSSKEKGYEICKDFALNAFNKADEEDRSGIADKTTAKIFYSAGTFFDILEQFGELSPEMQEKKVYSKWKATEIVNAVKEGRQPTPGGFGETPSIPAAPAAGSVSFTSSSSSSSSSSLFSEMSPVVPSAPPPSMFNPVTNMIRSVLPSSSASSSAPSPPSASNSHPPPGTVNIGPPLNSLDPRHNEMALAKDRLIEALKRLG
eukprot:gene33339-43102_t